MALVCEDLATKVELGTVSTELTIVDTRLGVVEAALGVDPDNPDEPLNTEQT